MNLWRGSQRDTKQKWLLGGRVKTKSVFLREEWKRKWTFSEKVGRRKQFWFWERRTENKFFGGREDNKMILWRENEKWTLERKRLKWRPSRRGRETKTQMNFWRERQKQKWTVGQRGSETTPMNHLLRVGEKNQKWIFGERENQSEPLEREQSWLRSAFVSGCGREELLSGGCAQFVATRTKTWPTTGGVRAHQGESTSHERGNHARGIQGDDFGSEGHPAIGLTWDGKRLRERFTPLFGIVGVRSYIPKTVQVWLSVDVHCWFTDVARSVRLKLL